MAYNIENYLNELAYQTTVTTAKNWLFKGNLTVQGTTTLAGISLTNLTTTGNTILGDAVTDTTAINGATTITTTSASGLTVGANGATNPVLKIDASAATVATGLSIAGAAAASGLAVAVVSSGTDENLTLNAKGAGTVTINNTATGNVVLGRAMTGVSASMSGALTAKSGTAVPATAGAVAAGAPITMFSSNISIWVTSDAPTHTATKGDLCINTGGSSSSTRLFINNGTTTWIAITTAS